MESIKQNALYSAPESEKKKKRNKENKKKKKAWTLKWLLRADIGDSRTKGEKALRQEKKRKKKKESRLTLKAPRYSLCVTLSASSFFFFSSSLFEVKAQSLIWLLFALCSFLLRFSPFFLDADNVVWKPLFLYHSISAPFIFATLLRRRRVTLTDFFFLFWYQTKAHPTLKTKPREKKKENQKHTPFKQRRQ